MITREAPPRPALESDLIVRLADFARTLRENGIRVDLSAESDAARALTLIDILDRYAFQLALRTTFRVRRHRWDAFDRLFDEYWGGDSSRPRLPDTSIRPPTDRSAPRTAFHRWKALRDADESVHGSDGEGTLPGYSPDELLRHKSFDRYSDADFAAMERQLGRLARAVATRRSRREVPAPHRGRPDIRRSLRSAVRTDGELIRIARKSRALERPDLVVLCDTSGSMEPYTRFVLAFMLAIRKVAKRCEIFAFNTSLTWLTPWIAPGKVDATLERLAVGVPDWAGGTSIGVCFREFVTNHRAMVTSKTTVLILSDGLDLGDPDDLTRALAAIRQSARTLIWLNPLLGGTGYEPTARGMQAALPFIDHFASAHDLASFERLIPHLSA